MIEKLVLKLNSYKREYLKKIDKFFNISSKVTHNMFDNSKKRIELEKIKIELKKKYFDLGLYVAKQYIKKGYSDFSLDDKFIKLNDDIKYKVEEYKKIKDLSDI